MAYLDVSLKLNKKSRKNIQTAQQYTEWQKKLKYIWRPIPVCIV